MPSKRKALSQAEIWDDSALIQSWNESYEEYKYYHSIAARGEKVKNVLAEHARATGEEADSPDEALAGSEDGEIGEDEEMMEQHAATIAVEEQSVPSTTVLQQVEDMNKAGPAKPDTEDWGPAGRASVPQAMIGPSTQDEALKSLMMSWYWAGYYSGLYEGQRQAAAGQSKEQLGGGANGLG